MFYPDADIPWLGPFDYLGPKTVAVFDPRTQQQRDSENAPFPVTPSHFPSFHTPGNLLWAKESLLQVRGTVASVCMCSSLSVEVHVSIICFVGGIINWLFFFLADRCF